MQENLMQTAIDLSVHNVESGDGGPFGAIVVKDGKIIGRGRNMVVSSKDPTAHAEIVAIREACSVLDSHQLLQCEIYCSCEPCPMCLGAIYWARPEKIYYANTREDAAKIGFDDRFIYDEICRPIAERNIFTRQIMRQEALTAFEKWMESEHKKRY